MKRRLLVAVNILYLGHTLFSNRSLLFCWTTPFPTNDFPTSWYIIAPFLQLPDKSANTLTFSPKHRPTMPMSINSIHVNISWQTWLLKKPDICLLKLDLRSIVIIFPFVRMLKASVILSDTRIISYKFILTFPLNVIKMEFELQLFLFNWHVCPKYNRFDE